MKKILVLLFVLMTAFNLYAQNTTEAGVSGSPYLMIIKDLPTKADVELTKTDVDVNISVVIADVTVRQYYRSVSDQVLEAVYVFPASVHAAVYSMKMKIGSREIVAVIKEKGEARREYEQAKLTGKRASLLVQDRPNLFQMNLANIAPGDLIEIEMKYTEMLVPDDKIYSFSFPTIVAPRYGGGESS
ncbi:MAG: VIT domain-containing protein, partial [bacterium]